MAMAGASERDGTEKRVLAGRGHADDPERLVHRHRHGAHRHVVYSAVIFVGPGGKGEQALDGTQPTSSPASSAEAPVMARMRSENSARRASKVLADEVKDLRLEMAGLVGPAERLAGGLDGVADILAVAVAHFTKCLAFRVEHLAGITAESPRACLPPIYILAVRSIPEVS